ncbi:MAG: ATP-binding cassette domain-containing protein, partial [Calditrichota bacterium]
HLNLHIPAGETVALIGKNGAGKSTLVRLLLNFIQPQNGNIQVDGMDINSFPDRQEYRRLFGIVNQNDFLFNISIRDNILFGLNGYYPDQDIYDVLRAVNLYDDINQLEKKLDTIFQNEIFSGGQRQRLLIARALIRDPRIVILDEPTSALDFENEIEVMNALEKLVQGRTTIIIAHRLSTVKQADRVLVMQDGAIVADGNHFELYDTSQYYRSLCDYNSFIGS